MATYQFNTISLQLKIPESQNISDDFKERYPQIVWKKLAGVRDRLIHHYFGVNYDIVWVIVEKELPEVILQIEMLWSVEKI